MVTKVKNANIKDGAITSIKIDSTVVSGITAQSNSTIIFSQAASDKANTFLFSISTINVANSTYFIKDDTAVNLGGGYIVITGKGFSTNSQVLINETSPISVNVVNSTIIQAQVASRSSGTYNVFVINPKGRIAVKVNGLKYSNTPVWTTGSTLPNIYSNIAFTGTFQANGATSYANTTALPTGFNLVTANGYYYGNISIADGQSTTYNFNIDAIDIENQETSRSFDLLHLGNHPQWANVALLLNMNNVGSVTTFRDNSNYSHVGTRQVEAEISTTYSKYGGASGSFPGNSVLYYSANSQFSLAGDFTIEFWAYFNNFTGTQTPFGFVKNNYYLQSASTNSTSYNWFGFSGGTLTAATGITSTTWHHFALTREGTTLKTWYNGSQIATGSHTGTISGAPYIGAQNHDGGSGTGTNFFNGFIDDLRLINGYARYTSAFTPLGGEMNRAFF